MLEQGHERRRREIRLGRAKHEIEEGAGDGARYRDTRRVVDGETVALEPRRDAPRQHPVRRDERRGLAWRLDARTEDQRDGFGFVMGGRGDDDAEAGERIGKACATLRQKPVGLEEPLPELGGLGGAQRLAHKMQPRAGGGVGLASRHIAHVLASRRRACAEARPCRLADARDDRQGSPAVVVEREIEARQHHGAVRQRGDGLEQPSRRRHRSRRSRRDHRVRRALGEPLSFERHQLVAARDRRDEPFVGEVARPMLGHDLEELDRDLPMCGKILGHDLIERGKIDFLAFDEVHKPREVGGKIGGLGGVTSRAGRPGRNVLLPPRRGARRPKASTSRISASRRASAPMAGAPVAPSSLAPSSSRR